MKFLKKITALLRTWGSTGAVLSIRMQSEVEEFSTFCCSGEGKPTWIKASTSLPKPGWAAVSKRKASAKMCESSYALTFSSLGGICLHSLLQIVGKGLHIFLYR